MSYEAKVLADSIYEGGPRITTLEATFPRNMLPEFNTHRVFSRNSASSRARPTAKVIESVESHPAIPIVWGANQSGMQAEKEISREHQTDALQIWLSARNAAVAEARRLAALGDTGVHKQVVNRLLEPYMWHTVIVTATEWDNFFALRDHANAQPEIRKIASMMRVAMAESEPRKLQQGEWHLPLLQPDEAEWAKGNPVDAIKVSVGRCARVSYMTHDGRRDISKDIELYERLTRDGHMSPHEHAARPMTLAELAIGEWSGNFRGWHQHRKDIPNEDNYARVLAEAEEI